MERNWYGEWSGWDWNLIPVKTFRRETRRDRFVQTQRTPWIRQCLSSQLVTADLVLLGFVAGRHIEVPFNADVTHWFRAASNFSRRDDQLRRMSASPRHCCWQHSHCRLSQLLHVQQPREHRTLLSDKQSTWHRYSTTTLLSLCQTIISICFFITSSCQKMF